MRRINRRIARQRLIALALLLAYLPACSSWRVENVPPAQLVESKSPSEVRITRADSSTLILNAPRIAGDSLRGWAHGAQLGVPIADIHAIATHRTDAGKTALVGLGVVGAVVVVAALASCGGSTNYAC